MDQTLGQMIAELRKAKGMTQKELAERMNVTDKAVSKWERNLSCPDINSIPRLAQVLEVSVEQLLNVSEQKESAQKDAEQVLSVVLKAVPLAMGIAVVALSILQKLEPNSAIVMLGIGMACLALSALKK